MTDPLNEDDDMSPTFNVDEMIKDLDRHYPAETMNGNSSNSGMINPDSIWAANGTVGGSDFLSYGHNSGWSMTDPIFNGFGEGSQMNGGVGNMPYGDDFFLGSSSPGSEAGSENWKRAGGFDFPQSAQNGAHMYAQALSQWNISNGDVYDPFNSTVVTDAVHLGRSPEPPIDSMSGSSTPSLQETAKGRPTFAEIAKNNLTTGSDDQQSSLSKDGSVYESQESIGSFYSKKIKPKAFRPAHPRYGGCHVPLPIQPDSKYGLDDFEIPASANCAKMERSLSCNDALSKSLACDQQCETSCDDADSFKSDCPTEMLTKNGCAEKGDWFDPKRIFKNGTSRARSESDPSCDIGDSTLLNNNSARVTSSGKASAGQRSRAAYINNLQSVNHRSTKQTNTDRASGEGSVSNGTTPTHSNGSATNGHVPSGEDPSFGVGATASVPGYFVSSSMQFGKTLLLEVLKYALYVIVFVIGITGQGVYIVVHQTCIFVTRTFHYLAVKVGLNSGVPTDDIDPLENKFLMLGLDENIPLPTTSDDAMRRLEQCKSKDAYSILGLRSDASGEEIKRYYKRQAVLVHPDKNQQPGAEEAFKILGRAFELIGDAEKRKIYDRKIQEEQASEDVMKHFTDLLTKFQEKMEEASLWMQCQNCGGKHRRHPTTKVAATGRKCARCQCTHPAKEGDIWAESTFMGFKWHFYACMDGQIYDVTPWISCQPHMTDKFKPNDHLVRMRMGPPSSNSNATPSRSNGTRESDLENLLKNLFPQSNTPQQKTQQGKTDWTPGGRNSNAKKTKRRSKRKQ